MAEQSTTPGASIDQGRLIEFTRDLIRLPSLSGEEEAVARRVEALTETSGLGVLAVTHYARLLEELRPDRIHVMMGGRIVASGGPEIAERLEASGYEGLAAELGIAEITLSRPVAPDPFSDPGF